VTRTWAAFLNARFDEDEAMLRDWLARVDRTDPERASDHAWQASRSWAEIRKNRLILETATSSELVGTGPGRVLLAALTLPYADHPDCREEWKS
jgi:hypothetical protein